ncbi:hypothetical protein FM113_15935 [Leucobacter sp. 7(1)]|uniref:B3/B4 domain-containing protein n=1 Tax=Leucobacter sp. 7(1) TaxID=1255613 RepID=UPI00097F1D0E|nr:phenylalanine--tRNA ligase beta subunit-related protein [Leucobacter sp. 7(1)]SJN12826.1 hypothetical protein FM113_15935 [Leucobacter sp. 7(1)]
MTPEQFLAAASVDPAVFELRPDYRAGLVVIEGLTPESERRGSSAVANELVAAAEHHAARLRAECTIEELAHIAAWRETYRAFGAKPQRTQSSLEALTRRAEQGLPRINSLTDIYNSISVLHQIPFGGEDFGQYQGPARLIRSVGRETFDTTVNGQFATAHPEVGEVVWCDDAGVTCRRWNWRQGRRTGLTGDTRAAFFILDLLAPVTHLEYDAAVDALTGALTLLGDDVQVSRRLIRA